MYLISYIGGYIFIYNPLSNSRGVSARRPSSCLIKDGCCRKQCHAARPLTAPTGRMCRQCCDSCQSDWLSGPARRPFWLDGWSWVAWCIIWLTHTMICLFTDLHQLSSRNGWRHSLKYRLTQFVLQLLLPSSKLDETERWEFANYTLHYVEWVSLGLVNIDQACCLTRHCKEFNVF